MRFKWMGRDCSMCQNLNTCDVFWMDQVHMMQSYRKVASGGKLQVLLVPWLMLGVYSLSMQ